MRDLITAAQTYWPIVVPWIGWGIATVVAPSMAPPTSPYGLRAATYRVVSLIAGNYGHASNASHN